MPCLSVEQKPEKADSVLGKQFSVRWLFCARLRGCDNGANLYCPRVFHRALGAPSSSEVQTRPWKPLRAEREKEPKQLFQYLFLKLVF